MKIASPRQPFVSGPGRFVVDVLDAGLVQHSAKRSDRARERVWLLRAHAEPQELDLLVQCNAILEQAVEGGCRIKGRRAQPVRMRRD